MLTCLSFTCCNAVPIANKVKLNIITVAHRSVPPCQAECPLLGGKVDIGQEVAECPLLTRSGDDDRLLTFMVDPPKIAMQALYRVDWLLCQGHLDETRTRHGGVVHEISLACSDSNFGFPGAADISEATTYKDIAGQWCGEITDYVFAPSSLTVKFHDGRPAEVFKIAKYTYTNDSVRIDWINSAGKESVTVFAEFIGNTTTMAQQQNGAKPRRPFHRC